MYKSTKMYLLLSDMKSPSIFFGSEMYKARRDVILSNSSFHPLAVIDEIFSRSQFIFSFTDLKLPNFFNALSEWQSLQSIIISLL
ncbi:hypothetical protein VCRA2113O326_20019 [Vibrio crassostreae]|nr:hypothetical protein VCRA2113O326_20019 [Vibrio crassostreae]CAK3676140.1 hypothetical protein VCRA2125O343_40274 [Vibrio crassostreae]